MEAATLRSQSTLRRAGGFLQRVPWLPVLVAIPVLFVASRWLVNPGFQNIDTVWSVVAAGSFIAVAAAGQGLVILTGGIDLSVPWMLTLGGVLITGWTYGANDALGWALPATLGVGAGLGALSGLGVAVLGISPVVCTIAMNGIVQGLVLVGTGGTPAGQAPAGLQGLMRNDIAGVPMIAVALCGFAIAVGLFMTKTTAGKRTYAVGNSQLVALLSGVPVKAILVGVYAFSGLTAALAGVLLAGYSSQSFLGMGDQYLLPSIAAVVIGGASILGGRGHYVGTIAGAIFLSLLTAMLTAVSVSEATRQIVFGCVILIAVLAVRERQAG
jgi:ribose transport system permease protein